MSLTISPDFVPLFTSTTDGTVAASGGGTTNFLRADGTWQPTTAGSYLSASTTSTQDGYFTGVNIQHTASGFYTRLVQTAALTANRTVVIPFGTDVTLASLQGTQTFAGQTTFSNPTVTVGNSTAASTYGLGTGATLATNTKAINIGTGGVSTSTTNIEIGASTTFNATNLYGAVRIRGALDVAGAAVGGNLFIYGADWSTAPASFTQGTLLAVPWTIINAGTNTSSLVSIQTSNSTNTWTFSSTGQFSLPLDTAIIRTSASASSILQIKTAQDAYTWSFGNTGILSAPGNITTTAQLASTVATGTAPLSVASTTVVPNLNASLLSGSAVGTSGATIPLLNGTNTWSSTNTFSGTVNATGQLVLANTNIAAGTFNLSTTSLQSHGTTATAMGQVLGMWGVNANGIAIEFIKGRGNSLGNATGITNVLVAGDTIAQIIASGFDATTVNNLLKESSAIRMTVAATPTVGFTPGKIAFWTAGTASVSASRVEINETGLLSALNGLTVSGATTTLTTGTATVAPLTFASGTNLTTAAAGRLEYDGSFFYATKETTSGRGMVAVNQVFRLATNGGAITTIANFYGATSALNLAASAVYDIEYHVYFTKTTAGTVTFTLLASSAPTLIFAALQGTPITGVGAGAPQALTTSSQTATTAVFGATGSLTTAVNHVYLIKGRVQTNLATTFNLQLTCSAGSATPLAGSYYMITRISATQGSFA